MRGLTCSSYAWSCVFLTILLWSLRIFMLLVRCSSILRPCSILLTVASCVLTQCPTHTQSVCNPRVDFFFRCNSEEIDESRDSEH